MINPLTTFWRRRDEPNVVLLRYEDMKADLEGQMRRLGSVLHIVVDEDRWPTLVEAATFDRMRDRAEELAPQVTHGFWNETGKFFNVGGSGQWRTFLDDSDIARYDKRLSALAPADLAAC